MLRSAGTLSMKHTLIVISLVAVGMAKPAVALGTSEFLQLSLEREAAYVDGILQGMSYVMANYDKAGSERWNACLRSQSVEATVGEVLQVLKDDPAGSSEPVPWAVMRVVNQRC